MLQTGEDTMTYGLLLLTLLNKNDFHAQLLMKTHC